MDGRVVPHLTGGGISKTVARQRRNVSEGVSPRSEAISRERRKRAIGYVGLVRRCGGAGKKVARGLPHDKRTAGGVEDGNEAELGLGSADGVPGNPDAVGSAKLGGRVMLGELLGREGEFSIGDFAVELRLVVVIGINDELPFDRDRLILGVVEVNTTAEAAGRHLAGLVEDGGAPQDGHACWDGEFAFLNARAAESEPVF